MVWYVGYVWCVWSVWYGMSGWYCMDGRYGPCKSVGYGMFDMTVCMVCMVCMVTMTGMEYSRRFATATARTASLGSRS